MNKLVTTQHAILTLCESDLGDDAYTLSRVALENAVIVAWLLNDKHWRERIDVYVNSYSQAKARLDVVFQTHHRDSKAARVVREATTEEDHEVFDELFNGHWQKWAVVDGKAWTFKDMASEVFESDFFYDLVVLETSWFVHSGFRSCLDIIGELTRDERFSLRVRFNRRNVGQALLLGNVAGLVALNALAKRISIGLSAQLEAVSTRFRKSGNETADDVAE